ncbi:GIY-YIG nuclease family protein [Legionella yabuuchiae]|uniref:GIY-YIG nuclease family protein n=1 Tax=Legionella yabuuchiae TaxID=376727 RepID=UPI003BF78D5C
MNCIFNYIPILLIQLKSTQSLRKSFREGLAEGFTKKYNVHHLVYYEIHSDDYEAITREKRIKKWNRQWKINLIEQNNPQ